MIMSECWYDFLFVIRDKPAGSKPTLKTAKH